MKPDIFVDLIVANKWDQDIGSMVPEEDAPMFEIHKDASFHLMFPKDDENMNQWPVICKHEMMDGSGLSNKFNFILK